MNRHFDQLTDRFAKLPGIGPRHAMRIVLALLDRPDQEATTLAAALAGLHESVRRCRECFNVAEGTLCSICRDPSRSARAILAVERVSDLQSIERGNLWRGRYHVLGTVEPGADGGSVRIQELVTRAREAASNGDAEVVLATGTDTGGEATALFAQRELEGIARLKVTRLARGLASGAHVEYADERTLQHALESRK